MKNSNRFDSAAQNWDTSPRVEIARQVARAIITRGHIQPGMRVLDFGAGTGLVALEIAEIALSVLALDTSSGMLQVLEEKCRARDITNVKTLCADIHSTNLPEGRFDFITASMVLHHINDTEAIMRRFYQLLAHNGTMAIADLDKEDGSFHTDNTDVAHFGFEQNTLLKIAESVGFTDLSWDIIHTLHRERDGKTRAYGIFLLAGEKASA